MIVTKIVDTVEGQLITTERIFMLIFSIKVCYIKNQHGYYMDHSQFGIIRLKNKKIINKIEGAIKVYGVFDEKQ